MYLCVTSKKQKKSNLESEWNYEASYVQERRATYYLVWRQSKWLLVRCNVSMGWMLYWGRIYFQGFLQLLWCFITRRIIFWRSNMTSTRINVSYRKSSFIGVRFLCKSNFCWCWGFATSLIAQINKVRGLVNAQIKLVYANKQVRLVMHASIGGALNIPITSWLHTRWV